MTMHALVRLVVLAAAAAVAAGCGVAGDAPDPADGARSGETLGFVISMWRDEIPDVAPEHCPDGLNLNEREYFNIPRGAVREARERLGSLQAAEDEVFPPDACRDPLAQPDPGFITFDADVPVAGLDLDGVASTRARGGQCAHDDFTSPDGQPGIDNQHWRLLGCTRGYQPDGQIQRGADSGSFIKEGIPILMEVTGVDDARNDDDVRVRFASSADIITLDAASGVVPWTSMDLYEDPAYVSEQTAGRITDGILTIEPVDVRLRYRQQVIDFEYYFRGLQVRAEVLPDGGLKGMIGAYWDIDNMFRLRNDHRTRNRHTGRGASDALGYMCAGMYHALPRLADGHPDPETGACTSISTAYHFEAAPAFVIDAGVAAAND